MAKILEARPPGRNWRVYDWDAWLDGKVWALEPGVDFPATTKLQSVRGAAYMAARRRGIKVTIGNTEDGVWIQADRTS
jgi:hypothetical protein